jgi:hypothetical protein
MRRLKILFGLLALAVAGTGLSADAPATRIKFENQQFRISMSARTPQQMAAFYEARGFTKPMIHEIRQHCFITTYIRNKSRHVLWADLKTWKFYHNGKQLTRLDREHWKQVWADMDAHMPSRSTFRWTLIPERLDYRPNEAEGGNIVLPRVTGPIQVRAHLVLIDGQKKGTDIDVELPPIHCAEDPK